MKNQPGVWQLENVFFVKRCNKTIIAAQPDVWQEVGGVKHCIALSQKTSTFLAKQLILVIAWLTLLILGCLHISDMGNDMNPFVFRKKGTTYFPLLL